MTTLIQSYAAARRMTPLYTAAFLLAVTALLMFSGPAWSFELDQPSSVTSADGKTLPLVEAPAPVPQFEDSCRALLKSVHYAAPSADMDRNRRSAGKAAALGLVFGVRFALGPKEVQRPGQRDRTQFGFWQPDNGLSDGSGKQALAIADYRRCRNEQALKALSDWRWER